MPRTARVVCLLLGSFGLTAASRAQVVAPVFAGDYSLVDLGTPPGVPGPLGGVAFLNPNTLLVGGNANLPGGAIYQVGVTRDPQGNITGYSGAATFFASAPNIDGGLFFFPNGTLGYTAFPMNEFGFILPGQAAPAATVSLNSLGIASSVGTATIVPSGFPNASALVIASYNSDDYYTVSYAANVDGTYALSNAVLRTNTPDGPEGIVYVPTGSPVFTFPSMLVSEYDADRVSAYQVDAFGTPIPGSRQDFITGLVGAEGGVLDPATQQFVFSTFQGGDKIVIVRGFVPAPGAAAAMAMGVLLTVRRRRA